MIGIKRIAKAFRSIIAIILAGTVMIIGAAPAQADLDILIVGSTHSFSEGGESGVIHEEPFNPSSIATELQSILASDPAIVETVNVVFDDVYKSEARYVQTSKSGWTTWDFRCYSLAQHYAWPTGITNRHADLRGENGTAWDYVVIMEDPYVMANFPGMFAEGADMLVKEVRSGTAEPILFAQWPENGSIYSASNFNEVVYRVGESAGVKVVPGGKGWDSLSPQDSSTSHPTPDGAYLAAASIYSELFDRSAKTSGYIYDDAIADHALSTVETNEVLPQFSGAFTNLTVFTMKYVDKRLVSYRETGTSTEKALQDALLRLDARCGMTLTPTATHDPTDWDFNYGRGNDWWENEKDYEVNPSLFDRSYGFPMHYYGMANAISHMAYGIDKKFYGASYNDGTDLGIAYNMIRPGTREASLPADVRCIPIRLLYVKMLEYSPAMNPLHDDTHMHYNLNDASAAFMYTLLSGRCPLVDEPSPVNYSESSDWMRWMGNKVGYETAWRMAHVTTRVPGFQVLPVSTNENIAPSTPTTLSVRFWYAPTSDVTVAVSTDDSYIGVVTPTSLTFTASNYTNAQTVTVIGQTGSAGTHEFNIGLTTSSADPTFDNLSDSWEFQNTREEGPLPSDIYVTGSGLTILSGDLVPDVSDDTDFGVTIGSVVRTFTITNTSGLTTIDLTNSPRVTVNSPSGYYALTRDSASSSLAPGAYSTFEVTYSPAVGGVHTATVAIASTDTNVPLYTFALTGTRPSPPAITVQGGTDVNAAAAELTGLLTSGSIASAWICWGLTDAGAVSTSDWENVLSVGSVDEGVVFANAVNGLEANRTYFYRCYSENATGSDWSDNVATFSGTPVGGGGGTSVVVAVSQIFGHNEKANYSGVIGDTINGSGMNGHGSDGTNTWPSGEGDPSTWTPTSSGYQSEWVSGDLLDDEGPVNGKVGWAIFDLGVVAARLDKLYLWHVRSAGDSYAASFNVYFAEAPSVSPVHGPTDSTSIDYDFSSDGWTLANTGGPFAGTYQGSQTVDLGDSVGRYVAVEFLSNNGHAERVGLSEVGVTALEGTLMRNHAPSGISENAATFNAVLGTAGTNYDVYVYYGNSNGGTNAEAWAASGYVGTWTNAITNISYSASSLGDDQTYYYTFLASNSSEVVWATPSWQFATPAFADPNLPVISSAGGATGLTETNALLLGYLVSTGAAPTSVSCYWNANSDPGATTAGWAFSTDHGVAGGTGAYTNDTAATAPLLPSTTYYYRYRAANSYGTNWSSVSGFTTLMPPTVDNATGATPVSETSALLRGELTVGASATAWICWGDDDGGTGSTSAWDNVGLIGAVSQDAVFSNMVSSLATNTTYYYRCYAINGAGEDWSADAATFSGTPADGTSGWVSAVPLTNGLKLWLDASDVSTLFQDSGGTTPITADGQTVGRWNDKSAAGNDASQGNASQEPAYITNGFNTLPALHFQEDCITSTFNADAPDITLFIVYQRVAANDGLWGHDNGGWDRLQIFDNNGPWNYGRGGSAVQISGLGNTDTNIYAVLSEGGVANGCTVYVNRDTTTTFTDNNSDGEDSITFGAINSSGAYAANNVKIAEVLIYDNILSSNDHDLVGGYLADKYGLSTAYSEYSAPPTIANIAPTGISSSVAMFNASLDSSSTTNDVYVYYGTSDGGTNAASWTSSEYIGSWTNIFTNVSYAAGSLAAGQTYYYTFMASNATTVSWASPSWQFATLGSQAVTTNYSVPHAWLAGINPAWTNDYEAAATNDYDNDGFSTWQEYWSGTDPMNGNSFLKIDAVLYDGSNVIIEWQHDSVDAAIPPIGIEVSADLTGTWVDVDYQMPSNGLNSWIDVNSTKRFYRLSATHAP